MVRVGNAERGERMKRFTPNKLLQRAAIALLATAIGSAAIGWIVAHPRDVTAASAD